MPSYVVTGASRGLGYAFVIHLASIEGNTVIGIARNKPATDEQLAKDGVKNVTIVAADINDPDSLQVAADETAKVTGGTLDVLINNAAFLPTKSAYVDLTDLTLEDLEDDMMRSFRANVVGVAYTINTFLPLIRKGNLKKVVTLSTGMADTDLINQYEVAVGAPYSISKAATNALIAKYNAALGKSEGILFFTISPGYVQTSQEIPATKKEQAGMQAMIQAFAKYAPQFKAPMTPEESVKAQMKVIDEATVEKTGGASISHLGNRQWL